ncbi:DUF3563 family protein [Paraburkholderia strydomiana]|uniref:DUF3563 family protein n=1 Tax=Paraburkholderia strydomiana TaxID=1245417 RepID=UPI002859FD41|nr:DUF3563 family protein [Paraburkholderia strydomiana]MDR7006226.1 hypothetical protein [Paraburkholderia strydomiana]
MFTKFAHRFGALFAPLHNPDHDDVRDAFLASSTDLADLERRMKRYDDDHEYRVHVHASVTPRDRTS